MHAAVIVAPKYIRLEERPIPQPGPGEVLIQVHYVAICGSDQARFWGRESSAGEPVVMGHEFSGRVATVGDGVTAPAIGQWVTVAPLLDCGECALCLAGKGNLCPLRRRFGRDVDGALREYATMRVDRVYPLPANVSAYEGAMVEPLAVACHAVRRASAEPDASALVLGAGAIGLLIAQVWRALHSGPVAVVDLDEGRLAVAAELGVPSWTAASAGLLVETLFEATGSPDAFATWLPALAPAGRAVIVGKLNQPVALDWVSLMRKEAEIVTSAYFTLVDFAQALQLLIDSQVRVSPLIGERVAFQRLGERAGQTVMAEASQVVRLLIALQEA
jgi:L-iditol 2-dehydrogenase